ncbi:MAG TPA: RNA 2',3'-cyclic phosphodiesterase [Longimicrobiales bacterium]|nr:RNA 2',3'-cyclic phosphodiesterase [Longimicrobiales bacterium]
MRTFIALNLPRDERERLHASLEPLRARGLPVRWVEADSLHITLKFLGEIEGVEVEPLNAALATVAARHGPLELQLGGFGAFPSLRRANVFWLGVSDDGPLDRLQRELELTMSRMGYAREYKPFRAHLTVGRTRGEARAPDVERLAAGIDYKGTVRIETLDLMRSHTGGTGSRYEALARWTLGEKHE